MSRDRRHDWDTPGDIVEGHLDVDSSASNDIANATKYVPTRSSSPVKTRSHAEKQKALGVANPVLSSTPTDIYLWKSQR